MRFAHYSNFNVITQLISDSSLLNKLSMMRGQCEIVTATSEPLGHHVDMSLATQNIVAQYSRIVGVYF